MNIQNPPVFDHIVGSNGLTYVLKIVNVGAKTLGPGNTGFSITMAELGFDPNTAIILDTRASIGPTQYYFSSWSYNNAGLKYFPVQQVDTAVNTISWFLRDYQNTGPAGAVNFTNTTVYALVPA